MAAAKDTSAAPVIDITKHGELRSTPAARCGRPQSVGSCTTASSSGADEFSPPSAPTGLLACMVSVAHLRPASTPSLPTAHAPARSHRRLLQAAWQGPAARAARGGARQVCEQAGGEEDQGGALLCMLFGLSLQLKLRLVGQGWGACAGMTVQKAASAAASPLPVACIPARMQPAWPLPLQAINNTACNRRRCTTLAHREPAPPLPPSLACAGRRRGAAGGVSTPAPTRSRSSSTPAAPIDP